MIKENVLLLIFIYPSKYCIAYSVKIKQNKSFYNHFSNNVYNIYIL